MLTSLRHWLGPMILAALVTACSTEPTAAPDTSATTDGGQALYERYCAVCHGRDGIAVEGTNSPHLRSQGLLSTADDAFLIANTARGRPGESGRGKPGTKMSAYAEAWGGPLSDDQIGQIVAYIRQWQTKPAADLAPYSANGDPAAGQPIYVANCAPCHGLDGWSAVAPSMAGSTFQETASDAFIRYAIAGGRPGSTMMTFTLDEPEMADLISYLRTLDDAGQ